MKYYIRENGYWEVPDNAVIPPDATVVTKCPSPFYEWRNGRWEKNALMAQSGMMHLVMQELHRVQKFLLLPLDELTLVRPVLDGYIESLRSIVQTPPDDLTMPPIPAELTDEAFFI